MDIEKVFKRYEIKYLLTNDQMQRILSEMSPYMKEDEFGATTISNIYYDTPDFRLIRRSLEKPLYKEKLRLRSYKTPDKADTVFLEIKKKYQSVVYKRRCKTSYEKAMDYLSNGVPFEDSQILREITYFLDYYGHPGPGCFISYDRQAYYGITDHSFRITFDKNILWRTQDLALDSGVYGQPILKDGTCLMEIKTLGCIPLWLTRILTEEHIYRTSFSKYGTAYMQMLEQQGLAQPAEDKNYNHAFQGGIQHVAINL